MIGPYSIGKGKPVFDLFIVQEACLFASNVSLTVFAGKGIKSNVLFSLKVELK